MKRISAEEKMSLPFATEIVAALKLRKRSIDQLEIEEIIGIEADDEYSQDEVSKTISILVEVPNVITIDMSANNIKYLIQD